jgi:CheY-like chemotaxis protein
MKLDGRSHYPMEGTMGSRVILADDSVTIQKVVGIIFANEGYELTVVAGGDAAVARAREIRPDVMLVDALMPGKNGYEVCREIRQDPALAHTAILLMTGVFEAVDEEKSRQSGADEFITKPFESQALIDVTNRLIALTAERLAKSSQAAAPPPLPAAAPVPPPAAPSQVDDIWATGFDDEPVTETVVASIPAAAPSFAPAAPAPVKVTSDDDIWGAFDMDETEAVSAPVVPAPTPTPATDDFFSFAPETPAAVSPPAENEFILEEVAYEATSHAASGFEPVGEQEISFDDFEPTHAAQPVTAPPAEDDFSSMILEETPLRAAAPAAPVPVVEDDFSTITFDEPKAEVAPPAAPPIIPVEPPAPVFAAPQPPPVAVAAPPQPAAPAATASGSLDEAQLRALLSTVSREVIERIVWEVVPDLAEIIIKEEIRKLKAGIA